MVEANEISGVEAGVIEAGSEVELANAILADTQEEAGVEAEAAEAGADVPDFDSLIGTVQELLPEELVVEEELNVRPFEGDGKKEQERVEELAASILANGQLQDGGVFPVVSASGELELHLFMGNRRRNAIALINSRGKGEPVRMRVRVFAQDAYKRMRQMAIHENLKRKNFSPMDLAHNIAQVRKENKWEAGKDTKNVAKYFGVSPAFITQHEKLLSLPVDMQAKVAEQGWGSDPAQFLAAEVQPAKQREVAARAEEIAKSESDKKGTRKPVTTKQDAGSKADSKADSKSAKVEKKHLVKAAREAEALTTVKPLAKSELLEAFTEIADSPAYGYANSPVRVWAAYFVNKFAAGTGSLRTMLEKFDGMVTGENGLYHEGTMSKAEKAELDAEEEAAKAKAQAKAAKGKKGKAA